MHPLDTTSLISGNNSVVECNLAKVDVASSNLVSRSKKSRDQVDDLVSFFVYILTFRINRQVSPLLSRKYISFLYMSTVFGLLMPV